MTRLQINPESLKVVEHRAEPSAVRGWRCDHEDGRGRCRSTETRGFLVELFGGSRGTEFYCAKHEGDAT